MEAMEVTSDATKIRLATFQLEAESQVWWDWVKSLRIWEAMTWEEFRELFMSKFFPGICSTCKGLGVPRVRQGKMKVLEYVGKFTELACFTDDYVATDMAKVRKFEDGLKLSIRGKIMGLLLQDMDSMVRTAMANKREIDDVKSIQDVSVSGMRKENRFPSSSRKKQRTSAPRGFQRQGRGSQGQGQDQSS